jgi:hypothetical protein
MRATKNRGPAGPSGSPPPAPETTKKDIARWFKAAGMRGRVPDVCLQRIAEHVNDTRRWYDDLRASAPQRAEQDRLRTKAQQSVRTAAADLRKLLDTFGALPPYDLSPAEVTNLEASFPAFVTATEILGEPQEGRPLEIWHFFAPNLLGLICGAIKAAQEEDSTATIPKIGPYEVLSACLWAIDGVVRDAGNLLKLIEESRAALIRKGQLRPNVFRFEA